MDAETRRFVQRLLAELELREQQALALQALVQLAWTLAEREGRPLGVPLPQPGWPLERVWAECIRPLEARVPAAPAAEGA